MRSITLPISNDLFELHKSDKANLMSHQRCRICAAGFFIFGLVFFI